MSALFDKVNKFYHMGLYSKEKVANFVVNGYITPEEYKLITGEDYVAPTV